MRMSKRRASSRQTQKGCVVSTPQITNDNVIIQLARDTLVIIIPLCIMKFLKMALYYGTLSGILCLAIVVLHRRFATNAIILSFLFVLLLLRNLLFALLLIAISRLIF